MEGEKITQKRADFHVHYDVKNPKSAETIIKDARSKNVVIIGLVGRAEYSVKLPELVRFGQERKVIVLPGVEYKARLNYELHESVDLICLDFNPQSAEIANYFAENAPKQQQINKEIAAKEKEFLETRGFSFDNLNDEDKKVLGEIFRGEHTDKAIKLCRIAVNTKKEYVEELKKKYPQEWQEVQERYGIKPWYKNDPIGLDAKFLYELYFANETKPGYQYAIAPYITPVQKVIEATHKSGGVVLYSPEGKFNETTWQRLVDLGIDGIMAWHGGRLELPKSLAADIRRKGLLILGGGDYDPARNHWQIGTGGENSMFISPKRYEELRKYKEANKIA